MSENNRQVALHFIEAMGTGNPELADACLAPDAFTLAKGYGKFAGKRHRDSMVGMINEFNNLVPTGLRFRIESVTASDDRVVVECEGDAITSQGTPYRNQYCFVFSFAGGKIRQVNEYFCNVHANEVLWPLVEAWGKGAAAG